MEEQHNFIGIPIEKNGVVTGYYCIEIPRNAIDKPIGDQDNMIIYWNNQTERLRDINAKLVTALESMKHADGCFCDAAFAGSGIVTHADECIAAQAALDADKGDDELVPLGNPVLTEEDIRAYDEAIKRMDEEG